MDFQKIVIPAGVAALVLLLFAHLGGTIRLGAHPFWSVQVAYIGIGAGAVPLIAVRYLGVTKARRLLLFAIGLIVVAAVTKYGKNGFTASYAEDRFAGKLWYYGWIASCSMAFCLLASVFAPAEKLYSGTPK